MSELSSKAPTTPLSILTEKQIGWLHTERRLLEMMREALVRFDASEGDLEMLRQAVASLNDLFLLVVVGEFNSGKSSFINALLGVKVMPEGVTPTTSQIHILRHGPSETERILENEVIERTFPADFLHQISVVDTPGTNAIIRKHEQISENFVPRSDLVLFITSADRPFTESERNFLDKVQSWGKKIIVILNKIDLLENPDELDKVLQFISENFQALLDFKPDIFPVSARSAYRIKTTVREMNNGQPATDTQGNLVFTSPAGDEQASSKVEELRTNWQKSGFGDLEKYIFSTLDQESRIRLKLLNPLGVAERVGMQYRDMVQNRLHLLDEDEKTIATIEAQLDAYADEMRDQYNARVSRIENIIHEMDRRADEWFDANVRLARIWDLVKSEKLSGEFERNVVADTPDRIERSVQDMIDWIVDRDLRMWQDIQDYLARRRQAEAAETMIGQVGGSFDYNRRELLQSVGGAARRVVESYDKQAEADELARSMREAVTQTALTGVGAVGLGTAIAVLVGTAAADISGILLGGALAGLGLFIIPARRNKARAEFHQTTTHLRERLRSALNDQFNTEIQRSQSRIQDSIAPYTRWVKLEGDKLAAMRDSFNSLLEDLRELRRKIEGRAKE